MEWLNYHHLLYFWTVAKEGGVTRASRKLRLSHSTVSGQIHQLEEALGVQLFRRVGRGLELTDRGRTVLGYADEIFSLGNELIDAVNDRQVGRPLRLVVGVADVLPKTIVCRMLAPVHALPEPVWLVCHEDKPEHLMDELVTHELDVVLSDAPAGPAVGRGLQNHLLGQSGLSFMGSPELAAVAGSDFPRSLGQVPLLLPTANTTLRQQLDHWLADRGLRPRVAAEIEDSALMEAFGAQGMGIFPVPTLISEVVMKRYDVAEAGRTDEVQARFYALAVARRMRHPAVAAICEGL
jgi:LysR family transcriptional activator of nhaA